MAKFPIVRAGGTLPGIAPAARANIDVRTGARELARGISALGESIQKYELMQASTQLSEFKRKVREEHNRLAISYEGNLDPDTFKSEYEKSLQVRQGLIPKNRFAAREARFWLNDRMPVWEAGVEKSRQLRIEDNYRAEGFELKTEAERTGDMTKFSQHLATGRLLGIYDAEEIVKLKQMTIDEAERNLVNGLIRNGQYELALGAVKKSQLDEEEKRGLENTIRIVAKSISDKVVSDSKVAADAAITAAYKNIVNGGVDITKMSEFILADPTMTDDDKTRAIDKIKTFLTTWNSAIREEGIDIVTLDSTRVKALRIIKAVKTGKLTDDEGLDVYSTLSKVDKINGTDGKQFINDIFAAGESARVIEKRFQNDILAGREKQLRDAIEKQQNILDPDLATEILKDFANIAVIELNDIFREGDFKKEDVDREVDRLLQRFTLSEAQQQMAVNARSLRLAKSLKEQQESITKVVTSLREQGKEDDAKRVMDDAIRLGIFIDERGTIKKGKKKASVGKELIKRILDSIIE